MNVLHLISSEGYYGAENMLVTLALELRRAGCGIVVGVFHNRHSPHLEIAERARAEGLEVELVPCSGKADWRAVRAIRSLVARRGIGVVHTHGYKADLYGYLAARRRVPVVATCHNWACRNRALEIYKAVDRLVLGFFDRVVAVSATVSALLRSSGVAARKLRTIANGIDVRRFENARPALGGRLVGMVGRLVVEKGPEHFLRAAAATAAHFPEARFALIGDGPARAELERLAGSLGVADKVLFAGRRDDMPGVYASLDVFVLPSLNEGLPLSVLEAMAAGVPVIATRVGAVPEVVLNLETGLLVNPGDTAALTDALLALLGDEALRLRLAGAGRRLVAENFSAGRMAREYLETYREVAAAWA